MDQVRDRNSKYNLKPFCMTQEYIDELKQLLDIAKHPQTQSLLQNALTELEKTSSKVEEHEQSETEQSSPEQTTPEQRKPEESKPESAKSTQNCAAGKVIVKPREPSKNLIRISNYGKNWHLWVLFVYITDKGNIYKCYFFAKFW